MTEVESEPIHYSKCLQTSLELILFSQISNSLLASLAIFIASNRMINVVSLPGLMSRHPQIRFECELARKQIIYCAVTGVILKIKYNTSVILGIKKKVNSDVWKG